MVSAFHRTDTSLIGRWWWTVDRWVLLGVGVLMALGAIMVMAASPPVAERLNLGSFHFVQRHLMLLLPAALLLVATSLLSPTGIRRLAIVLLIVGFALMVVTIATGIEVKGARRWLAVGGFSLQPSEFVKPAFAVFAAWLFAVQRRGDGVPGDVLSMGLFAVFIGLLIMQPDFGMAVTVSAVWFAQYFIAGLPMLWVVGLGTLGVCGLVAAYWLLPHVASRIDRFLDPAAGDNYQIETSLSAFTSGGLWGRGPGEGVVKGQLPDAHADFIFAVVGEEFGLVVCLLIIGLFAFVCIRSLARLMESESLFVTLAAGGLITQFSLQAFINIAVTLHLVPTKGMTLPFISYGGSSLLAFAIGMGMVLALTRRGVGERGRV